MSKLFIIEGPDCSGKTTLAEQIAVQRNAMYIHASGARTLHTVMHDYHKSLLSIARMNLGNGHDVVMDRLWPSEYVYGQIFRPKLSDSVYDFGEILQICGLLDPVYVFCNDPGVTARHEQEADSDHPYPKDKFIQIVDLYRQFCDEMMDSPALPNLHHPKTLPAQMKFNVRRYNLLEDGKTMGTFVDSL